MQRLHPLNLPLAWVWSLFVPVKYWRSEHLAPRWLARFEILDPAAYFTVEEWHREMESAFLAWRRLRESQTDSFIAIGYSASWQQWQAINFEERHLFMEMAQRAGHRAGVKLTPTLDRLWIGVLALGKTLRQARALFRRRGTADAAPCRIFWAGISASEVPVTDQSLSFCFAVERGLLDPGDCLYFLAGPPPAPAAERLRRLGVRWTTASAFGFLPLGARVRAFAALLGVALRGLLGCFRSIKHVMLWRFSAESVPWLAAAQALECRIYVTSVSTAWPEPPQVDALKAMRVRTINWSYGANTFCFSVGDAAFRDLGLLRSVSVAGEVWIWNDAVERWLRARSLGQPPAIRVIGPVMSGDSRWLARTPQAARAAYGLREMPGRKLVAVFDVPPINREKRLAIGHGPSIYPTAMLEQFFRDLEALLEELPQIGLVVKPKRSLDDTKREFAGSMRRILQSGRVIAVPHDIDPYIPVALADLCIGVPFTSPVLAALDSGRHGVFHDPLDTVKRVPGAPELMVHVTHGTEELGERVAALLRDAPHAQSRRDPAEVFAELLLDTDSASARPSTRR